LVALNRSANVTEYDIACRAYELCLARDCEDGHDVDDWLRAERELQKEREVHP
jgi:urease accessory protein UreF